MSNTDNNMIIRESLLKQFPCLSDNRIVYICAPAGYGKTVFVRQLLAQSGCLGAVITLDEYDNEPAGFCLRFCATLCLCQPENTALQKIAAHPAFDNAPDAFTLSALDALADDSVTCLVIDDLHFIHNERILGLLLIFLKRLPESFRIKLVSRNDLPPGFSELWIKGALTRITANDLRFNHDEIALLYEKSGTPITFEQAEDVRRFTDGWPIGVNAVILSGGNPKGDNLEYLDDFIQNNLWRLWDEATREFMIKTSVVRDMTPSLCIALTGNPDSEKLLRELVRQNTFISQAEQDIYRYHRLFYDFLYEKLLQRGTAFSHDLLKKAGYYYLNHNDFYNAVECFVKCGNHDGIIRCFRFIHSVGREHSFVDKLRAVADLSIIHAIADKYPQIYSLLSWAAFVDGRAGDAAYYSDRYYINHSEIVRLDPHLAQSIIFVSIVDFRIPLSELVRSLKSISVDSGENKTTDMRNALGTINQHLPLLHRGTRDFSECARENIKADVRELLSLTGGLFGDESALFEECLIAGLLYEQGHLDKAYSHVLAANSEIKPHFAAETKFFAMSALVSVLDSLEQRTHADQVIEQIASTIKQDNAYYLNYNFSALVTRRKLGNGDINAARGWLANHETVISDDLDFYRIYGHLTTCRAYITKGDYDSAVVLLTKVLKLAAEYRRPLDVIEAQILLSIAYRKKKRVFQAESMRFLEQAVLTAYEYSYSQLFINEGAEISGMLRRLQRRSEQRLGDNPPPSSFVKMLYLKTQEQQKYGLTCGQAEAPVKFTDRQKQIMKLMCDGKSYRDITEALGITRPTLRSHIAAIYKKLDVTNETDAVKKISRLGIFPKD